MGHVDVSGINYTLSDGQILLSDITFRVGDGAKAALVGPNGAGKTTLMRLIAGDISAESGTISRSGGLGVMRQFIGSVRDQSTVRDLLISVAPETIRRAANALDQSETSMMEIDDEKSQLAYAQALSDWADIGGYEWEVLWDFCCTAAISANSSFSIGVSLTAFQYSPSMKILPPRELIGVNVVTVFPSIVSAPAFTGKSCARKPFPITKTKNAAVTSVAGIM